MTTSGTVRQNRVLYTKLRETFAIPNKPKNLENISDILKPL